MISCQQFESPCHSTSSSAFGIVGVQGLDWSNRCAAIIHCGCFLLWISLMKYDMVHLLNLLNDIFSYINYFCFVQPKILWVYVIFQNDLVPSCKHTYKSVRKIFISKMFLNFVLIKAVQLFKICWSKSCTAIYHFLLKMNMVINGFFLCFPIYSSKKVFIIAMNLCLYWY